MPIAGWAYMEWAVLSLIWALDTSFAMSELITLIQLFVLGVLIADVVVHDPGVVRPILWVYSVSASVTAALGIQAYFHGGAAAAQRVSALPDQDPAQFAALLLPALVFSLNELLNRRSLVLSVPVALLTLAGVVLSGTRGAWVSLVVAVGFFVVPRLSSGRRMAAIIGTAVVLVAVLQSPGVSDMVAYRVSTAAATGGAGRLSIWTVGLEIFQSSPVTGIGFANFGVGYTAEASTTAVGLSMGVDRGPHNIIMSTLGELGVVGLALVALFLLPLVLRRGWGPDGTVVQAILASLLVDALFLDVLSNRKQVWLVIGLAAGLAYLGGRMKAADDSVGRGAAGTLTGTAAVAPDASPVDQPTDERGFDGKAGPLH
jgi:O-antigen ligase